MLRKRPGLLNFFGLTLLGLFIKIKMALKMSQIKRRSGFPMIRRTNETIVNIVLSFVKYLVGSFI